MTKIALFASGDVGLEVARFLGASEGSLTCLVVDAADQTNMNQDIITASCIGDGGILLKSDELSDARILGKMRNMSIDLGILAWWPYILKDPILSIAKMGFLNFHPSLLPYCRGKDPNFWAIVEGKPFGVTIHWVSDGIDDGDIAFQREIPVSWEDTGENLYTKAKTEIIKLFKQNYPYIEQGRIPRKPQDEELATFHRRSELDRASHVDLDQEYMARDLLNLLRARTFPPHPGCWFEAEGNRYEVRISIQRMGEDSET